MCVRMRLPRAPAGLATRHGPCYLEYLGALQASVSGSVAGAHAESDKNSYASTMRMHDEDQGPPPRFSINVKFLRRAYVAAMLAASQAKNIS